MRYGRTDAVAAVHQAAQALHALADGATDVEAGLQSALTEIIMVMRQLGAASSDHQLGETSEFRGRCPGNAAGRSA